MPDSQILPNQTPQLRPNPSAVQIGRQLSGVLRLRDAVEL